MTLAVALVLALSVPAVVNVPAPAGQESRPVKWVQIAAPGVGTMKAAVARPTGKGRFPAILGVRGAHGFAQEYVQLAQDLAQGGVLAIAPCWFRGGGGPGTAAVKSLDVCPDAPALPGPLTPESRAIVDALVTAARAMPDVRGDRIALFGQSRGASASLHYALTGGSVQALVLNSSGYPQHFADQAAKLPAPVLILHGAKDGPGDPGGNEITSLPRLRAFEAAARKASQRVEAHVYEDGGHTTFFTRPEQNRDSVQRITAFLQSVLAR
jgi:dienelactone hydrolase